MKYILSFVFVYFSSTAIAQQPKLMLPIGHTGYINSAQFSPDGKRIVTTSNDNTAKIWDAGSGILLADLKEHSGEVRSAVFSPDGKKIVTASYDNTAKIWDAASGALLADLRHSNFVNSAAFSPDGKKIVTASWDSTAKIWDTGSGALLVDLKGHSGWVESATFSPDGKKIVTTSDDTSKIWNAASGALLRDLKGHSRSVNSAAFSPDGKKIVTASSDNTAKIWDAGSGALLADLKGHSDRVISADFSPDGKKIVTASWDSTAKIWEAGSGALHADLIGHSHWVNSAAFSSDGKIIVTASLDNAAKIWDAGSGALNRDLKGHSHSVNSAAFSPDGKIIVTASLDNAAKIWDAASGALLADLIGHSHSVNSAAFSPDGKKIVTASLDNTAKIWDAGSGALLADLKGHLDWVNSAAFSPDGKKIVTASSDNTAKIWDAGSGALLADLIGHSGKVISADFSPDGKKIVTASWDNTAKIWDAGSGALLAEIGHSHWVNSAAFSPDGKKIVTTAYKEITAKIWDAGSGALLANLKKHSREVRSAVFSPDGKKIVTASLDNSAKIWDAGSGALLADLKGHFSYLNSAVFSPDGKKIVTASWDNTANIWDGGSGTLLVDLKGHSGCVESAIFSPDGKKIVTASRDNTAKIWNGLNGNLLYTFFAVDSTDYLIVDKNNRYDGTEAARKLLYFTCGTEIIELDQVKDQLWVPNLAERILNGDSINAKTLDELNICGLTPEMEDASNKENEYLFKILPRRGGLGETVLFVNGIETKRYKRADLKNNGGLYELLVKKEELKNYFIPGKENTVSVKAYTADNAISSRGLIITSTDTTRTNSTAPNLYAVMVGVSKYKGDELDLKYAAKDATDISNAIAVASRKLLNADGKEHVFIYNLTTAKEHYQLPEKNSIKKVLEEIGKKATANDILLIFFAGHGVMQGNENKKQFYFLTADASKSSAIDATAEVGISTAELTEWMKPSNIKAQKRIMIFDACNSGQAIKDFVKLGEPGQGYVVARSDEKGQQIKAIEKLNNQSGLFILAASASDQNAYEMGRYSQGLLTYALLKAIKQQPDILENGKYLDVSNWLNAAKKTVSTLAGETGARQEPQLNASNNFNIGMVDDDVRSKIVLSSEKPLFARSNFQNADSKFDNIKLRSAVDKELMSISSRGADGDITYSAEYEGTDAYGLTGEYKIAGDSISTSILLIKGGIEILQRFEIKGNISDINSLAISITNAATAWLKTR